MTETASKPSVLFVCVKNGEVADDRRADEQDRGGRLRAYAPELHALNAWLDDQALIARYLAARPQALKRAVRSHDTVCATMAWVDLPVPDNDRARNAHSHPIPPMVMRR